MTTAETYLAKMSEDKLEEYVHQCARIANELVAVIPPKLHESSGE